MNFIYDDGGRSEAGFKGIAGDCVCRAIAIATQKPYRDVYDELNALAKTERKRKGKALSSAREGVWKWTYTTYLTQLGFVWTPTMTIGAGCKVHLREDELPSGRLVVRVSLHMTAVIDGVLHDTEDHSRNGTRCVYGFFR